tara:strand:- start:874 stop:1317 length:444 start_codon:yes stop_codon:yes gene_type:complete
MKLNKIIFASFLSILPFQSVSIYASELFLTTQNNIIEEIKLKRVNKKGNLVVKFCNSLTDYTGYVKVDTQKFLVSDADVVKDKKLVWKATNLPKLKGDAINTDNLLSEGKNIVDGNCKGAGILPLVFIGAGLAIGAGSGGSSSSSSN